MRSYSLLVGFTVKEVKIDKTNQYISFNVVVLNHKFTYLIYCILTLFFIQAALGSPKRNIY